MLISKLFILLEPERVGKFRVFSKLEIKPNIKMIFRNAVTGGEK